MNSSSAKPWIKNRSSTIKRGLGSVLGSLAEMGFDARWGVLGADSIGAPHARERIWILGYHPDRLHADRKRGSGIQGIQHCEWFNSKDSKNWRDRVGELGAVDDSHRVDSYANAWRVFSGMADWVDRLATIGNGQVPAVVQLAWNHLSKEIDNG